jgi:hypothetical protein
MRILLGRHRAAVRRGGQHLKTLVVVVDCAAYRLLAIFGRRSLRPKDR